MLINSSTDKLKIDLYSQQIQEFLSDKKGMDDISIFFDADASEEDTTLDYSKIVSFDLSEKGIKKAAKKAETDTEKGFFQMLKGLFTNKELKDTVDKNGDGKISNSEMRSFLKEIRNYDGNVDDISLNDFAAALSNMGVDLTGDLEEETEQQTKAQTTQTPKQAAAVSSGGGVSSSGSVNSGGAVSSSSGSGASSSAVSVKKADTIESLTEEKTTLETEIKEQESEIAKINDGTSDKVSQQKEAVSNAEKKRDEAIKNDKQVDDELKKSFDESNKKLEENEHKISAKSTEISQKENSISQAENSLSNLQSALSSLGEPTGKEEDKEQDAKLTARKSELQSQISAKETEISTMKSELEKLKSEKSELEKTKETLSKENQEIQQKILEHCSPETKQAIEEYNNAKKNFEETKQTELAAVQSVISSKIEEISQIDAKIQEMENKKAEKIDFNLTENLSDYQKNELAYFEKNYEENKERYEKVAEQTGVPAELVAAIHWRESSGNFDTYLHNGDPLGQPTTHVPAGIYCETWEESAIDALKQRSENAGMSADCTDLDKIADFAENYNGYGYRNKGLPSPYVWAGTTNYSSGKYVADGVFDANAVDNQLGVMVMMKNIM